MNLGKTVFSQLMSLLPDYEFNKGAVKMHTLFDLQGSIPTFIKITPGSVHDVNILDQLPIEAGAFYIMDMGYIDYQRLFRIQQAGGFFVIRAKENMAFDRVYSHSVHKELGIQVDQTIKFTHQQSQIKYPAHLRRIKFHNREKDKTFIFLTNHFDIDATTIAGLYKERWKIELFFRWIKQHLKIKSFYGTSENAIHYQIWIAICTYLLMAIAKKKLKIGQSLYSFLQVISISIFEKEPVNQLVSNGSSHFKDSDFSNQLILF